MKVNYEFELKLDSKAQNYISTTIPTFFCQVKNLFRDRT